MIKNSNQLFSPAGKEELDQKKFHKNRKYGVKFLKNRQQRPQGDSSPRTSNLNQYRSRLAEHLARFFRRVVKPLPRWVPGFLATSDRVVRGNYTRVNEPWRGDARDLEGASDPTLTSVARERERVRVGHVELDESRLK